MKLITRTLALAIASVEVMMDLEVRKPHLDLLALIARLLKLWGAHECAGMIAGFFVDVACNLSRAFSRFAESDGYPTGLICDSG